MSDLIVKLKENLPSLYEELSPNLTKKTTNEMCGPCFICGGDDRFTLFIDTDTFFCRQCEEKGDSIDYHRHYRGGLSIKELADSLGLIDTRVKKSTRKKGAWPNSKKAPDKIKKYFASRSIIFNDDDFPVPPSIHYSAWNDKDSGEDVRSILCAVVNLEDSAPEATHRTFLTSEYKKHPDKKRLMKGDIKAKGRGVWFYRSRREEKQLIIGEGLETVLSAMQATGINGVAGLDSGKMQGVYLPDTVEELFILVDEDVLNKGAKKGYAGQRAGLALAKKFEESKNGRIAKLITPSGSCFSDTPAKKDFNDLLVSDPSGQTIKTRFDSYQILSDIDWKPPKKPDRASGEEDNDNSQPGEDFPVSTLKMLQEVNKNHAAVLLGGKFRVIKENIDKKTGRLDVSFMEQGSFSMFYKNKKCWVPYGDSMIPSNIGKVWLEWSQRRTYSDVVFSPGNNIDKDEFNLFRGFAVEPAKGDWSLMQEHIFSIICSGDIEIYKYVLAWMADTVQNPGGDRPGVAIVLTGGRGTGKGIFANSFGKIFGGAFIPISSADGFTGQFNMHLSKCMVAFLDEAVWGGDKKSEGRLKAMITEPTMLFQPKGIDSIALANYMRVIMASNEDWVVPAGEDERRFCVLKTSSDKQKDFAYFRAIDDQMKAGGVEAMMHDLLQLDYSGIELRNAPKTAGLAEQVEESLNMPLSFWKEVLSRGYIFTDRETGNPKPSQADGKDGFLWPESAWKHEVYHEFLANFCKFKQHSPRERQFWKHTYRWYNFRETISRPLNSDGRQAACLKFLPIDNMRSIFGVFAGETVWD